MKIVIAIDSFKGCLTSSEANEAARLGVLDTYPDADVRTVAVSDGGEGWLDSILQTRGGEIFSESVHDPLMRTINADYLFLKESNTVVVESAKIIGLGLLKKEERNPLKATSYGLGEIIMSAWARHRGCRFIIGLGGTSTSDSGIGMLKAINAFCQQQGIQNSAMPEFLLANDVSNPLCGPQGAARVFAPQKGADKRTVEILERRARRFAFSSARQMNGKDCSANPGAGAAGGLGYAFMQYLNATCQPGIDLLLKLVEFSRLTKDADIVVTGEGSADHQTLLGKAPIGILNHIKQQWSDKQKKHPAVCLIAGKLQDKELLTKAGFNQAVCINPPSISLQNAMQKEVAVRNIRTTVSTIVEGYC